MEVLLIVNTGTSQLRWYKKFPTYWSVVSLNCIADPSGATFVCEGMKMGPRGASKSVDLGGGSLYRMGAGRLSFFLLLCEALDLGSGVARALVSGARDPPLDSRFFRDSFFALDARSRARGTSSWALEILKSGFSGDDTAGWWSSSRARFGGSVESGGGFDGVASLWGEASADICTWRGDADVRRRSFKSMW